MSARAWVLFAATSLIWGLPYLFIKVAVDADVPPVFVAFARVAIAAALLLPIAAHFGALRGLRARAAAIAGYAALEVAIPFTLIAIGEEHVASSLAAILIASMPLMVALLSLRFVPDDRPTRTRVLGLLVGLAGVVALLGIDVAGSSEELFGAALILVAALCYASAPMIVTRRLADLDPLGPVAASLVLATIVLLPVALLDLPTELPPADALAAIVALGVVCTAAGLLVFFALIAAAGPGRASVITYMNPIVALILGVIVLDEQVGAGTLIGLAAILAGSWIATAGRSGRGESPSSPPPPDRARRA